MPELPPFRFVIAASFTAEPLSPYIEFWQDPLQAQFAVDFAPFGQILQTLLDPNSVFRSHNHGVNVVLFRYQDLGDANRREENAANLREAIRNVAPSLPAPLLVIPDGAPPDWWQEIPNAWLLPPTQIEHWYPVARKHSRQGEQLGAIPYTEDYYLALGSSMVRAAHSLNKAQPKVLVLDCDNTLWQGICGEDGPEGVSLTEGHAALQRFAMRQRSRGLLLALSSKNNDADVLATFAAHPEFLIQLADITTRRIDWLPKSTGIASIAGELSLGLDSFVFLDDNAKEVSEVGEQLPQVLSLALPGNHAAFENFLEHVWAFDQLKITSADAGRAASYEAVQQFGKALQGSQDLDHFLQTLELVVDIHPVRQDEIARAAQLTQRTNQFNFTTIRCTEAEFESSRKDVFAIYVKDRFGDYGFTGLLSGKRNQNDYIVENFLLSCRVLGRGVEHRVMNWLGEYAAALSCQRVQFPFQNTPRNAPAAAFHAELPESPEALMALKPSAVKTAAPRVSTNTAIQLRVDYGRIASTLSTVAAIRGAIRRHQPLHLATATENELAVIWQDLLGVERIEPKSNFFDLGGHSLKVVLLLMRIEESFGITLGVEDVYASETNLERMARRIDERIAFGGVDHAEYTQILNAIESMTEEEALAALERESTTHADPTRR